MLVMLGYIDPGSGSLIIQMLIATAVAIPLFFRHQVGRFIGRFRRPASPTAEAPVAPVAIDQEHDA